MIAERVQTGRLPVDAALRSWTDVVKLTRNGVTAEVPSKGSADLLPKVCGTFFVSLPSLLN
jgi:hypothetical protein